MKTLCRRWVSLLIALCLTIASSVAWAESESLTTALDALHQAGQSDVVPIIDRIVISEAPRAIDLLAALRDSRLKFDEQGRAWIEQGKRWRRVDDNTVGAPSGRLEAYTIDNATRRHVEETLARLRLRSSNLEERRIAAKDVAERADPAAVSFVRELLPNETDAETRTRMELAIAKVDLRSPDVATRIRAANVLAKSTDVSMREQLEALIASGPTGDSLEPDPEVRKAMRSAIAAIAWRELMIRTAANFIYGLSLGSTLLLAALGLAITFGLMKVINMAHGEMLMLGAYATYVTQSVFNRHFAGALDYYLIVAIPVAFVATAVIGLCLERLVVSKLYGRPLETLLATWGLSLVLIQAVRSVFGAQNVTVANPQWLIGGLELMPTLVVPYSRLAVLAFTVVVVGFVWFVLQRTSLGLKLRAITQNREMAAALGINTRWIDAWAFSLGSGVAGLGGVALSQLGNVGPELGQQHIIDSFMVVVLGGVGNIVGSILGAMGLGVASKFIEPSFGAVLGKIAILVAVILFIQWRPQGMFALKGRAEGD